MPSKSVLGANGMMGGTEAPDTPTTPPTRGEDAYAEYAGLTPASFPGDGSLTVHATGGQGGNGGTAAPGNTSGRIGRSGERAGNATASIHSNHYTDRADFTATAQGQTGGFGESGRGANPGMTPGSAGDGGAGGDATASILSNTVNLMSGGQAYWRAFASGGTGAAPGDEGSNGTVWGTPGNAGNAGDAFAEIGGNTINAGGNSVAGILVDLNVRATGGIAYNGGAAPGRPNGRGGNFGDSTARISGNEILGSARGDIVYLNATAQRRSPAETGVAFGPGDFGAAGVARAEIVNNTVNLDSGDDLLEFRLMTGHQGSQSYSAVRIEGNVLSGGDGFDVLSLHALFVGGGHLDMNKNSVTGFELIRGSAGSDTITGAAANDVIAGGLGDDSLDGGSGVDTVTYSDFGWPLVVSLNILGPQNTGAAGLDTLSSFENLIGGGAGDRLTGHAGANIIEGGGGGDTPEWGRRCRHFRTAPWHRQHHRFSGRHSGFYDRRRPS